MNEIIATLGRLFSQVAFWATVAPWELALRVRAGRHVRCLPPGLHLRIPIIDQIFKQSVRLRSSTIPTQTLSTTDGATVIVGAMLSYAIGDIKSLYDRLHHAEDTVTQLASGTIASIVSGADRAIRPDALSARATLILAEHFAEFGLVDVTVRVTDFAFMRAFRLVQDGRWSGFGDALSTKPAP